MTRRRRPAEPLPDLRGGNSDDLKELMAGYFPHALAAPFPTPEVSVLPVEDRRHEVVPIRPQLAGEESGTATVPDTGTLVDTTTLPVTNTIPASSTVVSDLGTLPESGTLPDSEPLQLYAAQRARVFRATLVQHGHSAVESAVYQALWNHGIGKAGQSFRDSAMSYETLGRFCNLNWKSAKQALRSLQNKLAIRLIQSENQGDPTPRVYRVFDFKTILAARNEQGLIWVRKTRSVELFQTLEEALAGHKQSGRVPYTTTLPETTTLPVFGTLPVAGAVTLPVAGPLTLPVAGRHNRKSFQELREESSSSVSPPVVAALRAVASDCDDDVVRHLSDQCRKIQPTATDEEIVHFIHLKAGTRGIKQPLAFLLKAVPRCFEGESFRQFREEERRKREREAAAHAAQIERWRRILQDPSITDEEREIALQAIGEQN